MKMFSCDSCETDYKVNNKEKDIHTEPHHNRAGHDGGQHYTSLEHGQMLAYDLMLRLSADCGEHRCNEFLSIIRNRLQHISEFRSRHQ